MTFVRAFRARSALFFLGAVLMVCVGWATLRSDFQSRDEEPLFEVETTSSPSSWETDPTFPGILTRVEGGRAGALHLTGSSGGATLPGSLVSDFRMEFSLRLEGESQAMINFRNYSNNRHRVIIQPEWMELRVARGPHRERAFVKGTEIDAASGTWHNHEIVAVGTLVRISKEGRLLLEAKVENPPSGTGNIWFECHEQYSFADVRVARIGDSALLELRKDLPAGAPGAARQQDPVVLRHREPSLSS